MRILNSFRAINFMYKIVYDPTIGKDFTFIPNKKLPIYNWFYYKEGFSRNLVISILKNLKLNKGATILDPFCGSGTTLLAAKELGMNSIGFDVMPISVLASKVKTENYDIEKLREYKQEIFSHKFQKPKKVPKKIKKWFSIYTIEDIIFFREIVNSIEDEKARNFFTLALITSAIRCSYIYKDGSVLKIRKRKVPPFRFFFKRTSKKMINDLKKFPKTNAIAKVDFGDARNLNVKDESISAIITSPPYLNKIEYKNVYRIENELFFSESPKPPLRSFFGLNSDDIEKSYFKDIEKSLKEMHRVLKEGSKAYIIIGDALVNKRVVDVLEEVSELSKKYNFEVEKIIVGNRRIATTPQREKVGTLREGMIVIRKN